MAERSEYVCETPEDSDDIARVAVHFGLNAEALAAARDAQCSFSALGLGHVIAAYVDRLGEEHVSRPGTGDGR